MKTISSKKKFVFTSILILLIVLSSLALAELVLRTVNGALRSGFKNLIIEEGGGFVEHHYNGIYQHDSRLGWTPQPNTSTIKWEKRVTINNEGFRSNGNNEITDSDFTILAVGDSLTFGEEVADHETWPAILESITQAKVLNAGVSSYGLDQIIMQADRLILQYRPDVVIISCIWEDINIRLRQALRHGVPKPYFTTREGKLFLKNDPVPIRENLQLGLVRNVFGRSYVIHRIMSLLNPNYWWKGTMKETWFVDNKPSEIANRLFNLLLSKVTADTNVVLLIQDGVSVSERRIAYIENILSPIKKQRYDNLVIINTQPILLRMKEESPSQFYNLFNMETPNQHMSPDGNRFIAEILKDAIAMERK